MPSSKIQKYSFLKILAHFCSCIYCNLEALFFGWHRFAIAECKMVFQEGGEEWGRVFNKDSCLNVPGSFVLCNFHRNSQKVRCMLY